MLLENSQPLPSSSVKARFVVSVVGNSLRGVLNFVSILFIARGLGPEQYGNFYFLLGSFAAIKTLLDMGTSQAFYTFISRRERGRSFFICYALWQFSQFVLALLVLSLIIPSPWLNEIWLGQERNLVILAFVAVFAQQQAWMTLTQIGEASRLTQKVQIMNLSIAAVHFLLVGIAWSIDVLSIKLLFIFIFMEYVVAIGVACRILPVLGREKEYLNIRSLLNEYAIYCIPLFFYSCLGFIYEFADRWLLQNFGGGQQQGLYAIGHRFSMVTLLATSSMLAIFWKEIAEALENKNMERLKSLYRRISRFLYTLCALLIGFLVPWSSELIRVFLGPEYQAGVRVLEVMFIFSVHATLGQVNGAMLLATSKTRALLMLGAIFMGASIPISYWVQAPADALIAGLELGALGMALKVTVLNIMRVNVTGWWISRQYGWKFDWVYQVVALSMALFAGWISFKVAIWIGGIFSLYLIFNGIIALLFYIVVMGAMIWFFPQVAGLERWEIKAFPAQWKQIFHL